MYRSYGVALCAPARRHSAHNVKSKRGHPNQLFGSPCWGAAKQDTPKELERTVYYVKGINLHLHTWAVTLVFAVAGFCC